MRINLGRIKLDLNEETMRRRSSQKSYVDLMAGQLLHLNMEKKVLRKRLGEAYELVMGNSRD